jgi:bisphosphoglycerate-dependent phosphoglycerate mutase
LKSKIIFIRHGESLGNANRERYFLPDPAIILSDKGVMQCIELMGTFPDLLQEINDFDGVFTTVLTSQFQRAKLTAEIVTCKTKLRNPIVHDARLNEAFFDHSLVKLTETRSMIKQRVLSVLQQYPFNVIMFCHGQFMESIDHTKPRPRNCEVRIYDREDLLQNYLCWNEKDIEQLEH